MTIKSLVRYSTAGTFCLLMAMLSSNSQAEVRPFVQGSLDEIVAARNGQLFLLVLWSVDCPPCFKELAVLQKLRAKFGQDGLVLLSTDEPEYHDAVSRTLAEFELDGFESWAFADSFPERLRYQIDPNWFGELPRSYFYDARHRRSATSGALSLERLQQWLEPPSHIDIAEQGQDN